jgi:hypothetical protein
MASLKNSPAKRLKIAKQPSPCCWGSIDRKKFKNENMITGNEPAMPVEVNYLSDGNIVGMQTGNTTGWVTGLTIRQHYAGLAMQGLCVSNSGVSEMANTCAEAAVKYADALIAQLNKTETMTYTLEKLNPDGTGTITTYNL